MILLTPLEREGQPGWTQTRLECPSGGGAIGQLARLLRRLSPPEAAGEIALRSGQGALWRPRGAPEFEWAPEPDLAPWISDRLWRARQRASQGALTHRKPPAHELCWLWSPRLRRWETPLFLLSSDSNSPRLRLSFQAAASLLYLWDADALWLSGEWGREMRPQELMDLAAHMSAEGMRQYHRECFGAKPPHFDAGDKARWSALQEAKDLEEAASSGRSGSGSNTRWL